MMMMPRSDDGRDGLGVDDAMVMVMVMMMMMTVMMVMLTRMMRTVALYLHTTAAEDGDEHKHI